MKKYLFSSVLAIATALTGAVVLTSCSHDEVTYNEENVQQAKHAEAVAKYEQAFINRFGQPAANQSWDFTQGGSFKVTRGHTVVNPNNLVAWPSYSDHVYGINYKAANGNSDSDPLQESTLNRLFNNHLSEIYNAINEAENQTWAPTDTYLFRTFSTHLNGTLDKSQKESKYYSVGASFNNTNNVLAQEMHKWNDNNPDKRGTTGSNHTCSLNFDEVPSGSVWFACATTSGTGAITPANFKLENFREVELTFDGTTYTFWGFKCETNGGYTDLILIVQKITEEKTLKIAKRYMVEDLGGSDESDIDFNDVVFDVLQYSDGSQECIVRALGGTLPITIKVGSTEWSKPEPVTKMQNTQAGYNLYEEIAIFEIGNKDWNYKTNNVEVHVKDVNGFEFVTTFPNNGNIPAMIAFSVIKEWNVERVRVTSDWFNTLPFVFEEDE